MVQHPGGQLHRLPSADLQREDPQTADQDAQDVLLRRRVGLLAVGHPGAGAAGLASVARCPVRELGGLGSGQASCAPRRGACPVALPRTWRRGTRSGDRGSTTSDPGGSQVGGNAVYEPVRHVSPRFQRAKPLLSSTGARSTGEPPMAAGSSPGVGSAKRSKPTWFPKNVPHSGERPAYRYGH